jgi:hypothetical protein
MSSNTEFYKIDLCRYDKCTKGNNCTYLHKKELNGDETIQNTEYKYLKNKNKQIEIAKKLNICSFCLSKLNKYECKKTDCKFNHPEDVSEIYYFAITILSDNDNNFSKYYLKNIYKINTNYIKAIITNQKIKEYIKNKNIEDFINNYEEILSEINPIQDSPTPILTSAPAAVSIIPNIESQNQFPSLSSKDDEIINLKKELEEAKNKAQIAEIKLEETKNELEEIKTKLYKTETKFLTIEKKLEETENILKKYQEEEELGDVNISRDDNLQNSKKTNETNETKETNETNKLLKELINLQKTQLQFYQTQTQQIYYPTPPIYNPHSEIYTD